MKTKISILAIFTLLLTFTLIALQGCTNDTNGPTTTQAGFKPTLRIKLNESYQYTNDTIYPTGVTQRTPLVTNDTVKLITNYNGKDAYGIISYTTTRPTLMYYVSYDSGNGILYQWGLTNLINPSQVPTWDVVANFGAARGSTWVIGQINDTITLPSPYGNVPVSGPLTGKVADSTIILTTALPVPDTIHCYRIAINANISGTAVIGVLVTFTASIDVDYYVGYYSAQFPNNPSGLVRLKLFPFQITTSPPTVPFSEGGYDRILQYYHIP